jgi:hypothetical protein
MISAKRSFFCIAPLAFYVFMKLKGTGSLNHKKNFQQLKPKICGLSIGRLLQITVGGSQSANDGSRLADFRRHSVLVSIAGMSLPLKLKMN